MTFVAAVMAVSASAQVYVGGNVGIASYDPGYEGSKSETVYSVLPEIGYSFDSDWAAGVAFGWSKGALRQNDLTFDSDMTSSASLHTLVSLVTRTSSQRVATLLAYGALTSMATTFHSEFTTTSNSNRN